VKMPKKVKRVLEVEADAALRRALDSPVGELSRYRGYYNTLEIRFAEGSDPQVVSIPYQPFEARAFINLPLRVVKEKPDDQQ